MYIATHTCSYYEYNTDHYAVMLPTPTPAIIPKPKNVVERNKLNSRLKHSEPAAILVELL